MTKRGMLVHGMSAEDQAIFRRFGTTELEVSNYIAHTMDSALIASIMEHKPGGHCTRAGAGMSGVEFDAFCREVYGIR